MDDYILDKNWKIFQVNRRIPEQHKILSCYAPFNHMRIRRDGGMSPCCFSTKQLVWKKDEVGLKDYWFGSLNDAYRDSMMSAESSNDLHQGCKKICGGRINQKLSPPINDYDWNVGDNRLEHALLPNAWPKIFEFEISNLCNFACPMCMGELSSKHMLGRDKDLKIYKPNVFDDDDNLEQLISQFKEFLPHLDEIRFVGGEPFAHKALYKICDLITNINPALKIQVCTNGSVYNKKVEKICKENNLKLSISCDTVIKEEYEQIRIGGVYEETFNNIQKFKVNASKVKINSTLMSINTANIDKFFLFSLENDLEVFINTYDREGRGHTPDWNLFTLPRETLYSSVEKLHNIKCSKKNTTKEIFKCIRLIKQAISIIEDKDDT